MKDKWVNNSRLMWSGSMDDRVPQKVAEIIDQTKRIRRIEDIREHISNDHIRGILAIPICKSEGRNRIVWPNTKNREYTIKTGYHKLKMR